MEIHRASESPAETAALAEQLAGLLRPGDVVALHGELGAGKTTLVRGVVAGLGLDPAAVSSPTFVVANEYPGSADAPPIVHVDAYRLGGTDELDTIGWDRLLDGSVIIMVEWASRIADALPDPACHVRIVAVGESSRRFSFEIPRGWLDRPGLLQLARAPSERHATTCPVTGVAVAADAPTWPFADERARLADLYRWMHESYSISRDIKNSDLEEGA